MEKQTLSLTPLTREYLSTAANWANFLSIICFILLALGVLGGLAMLLTPVVGGMTVRDGEVMSVVSGIGILYLMFCILYMFPVYYLNRFATNVRQALAVNDEGALENAMGYLKSHYKFIGILTIVGIVAYIGMAAVVYIAALSASL